MDHIFFHIDVNSAFLSWTALQLLEEGSDVDLRLVPSIIGGDSEKRHGVVLAKSVPAKAYDIITGEPVVNAYRKFPGLVMAAPDHRMYERRSKQFVSYLYSLCPDIEQASIDECYMDFTGIAHLYPSPEAAAEQIKDEVYKRFGFTVNIGISDKKVLAKMASDFKKPNLVHTLYTHEIQTKMWPLPVSSLYMCGKSSVQALRNLGILTIGDLATFDLNILKSHLKSHGSTLWEYANGIDNSKIITEHSRPKGIGNSTTLSKDVVTREEACKVLLSLSESVGQRLRHSKEQATVVCTEIKYSDFRSASHQTILPVPTASDDQIYQTSVALFDELWDLSPIRLLGIRTSKLVSAGEPVQLTLFDTPQQTISPKREKLDAALDSIRSKYGHDAIMRGSLLSSPNNKTSKE